ncbi:hypothetical protein ACFFV7_51040 [Nonomuraea spiralis]|uniref:Uncharacterized protein n=1 Tax=Nonomuraea spiralis TaxID=46182 RepID=A0ABV5J011_9ACTN|nr:hypothetical protein [Nonomuraea spiralis]GGS88375.1 hypothetical protein GCM10010176_035180 [Nonomuraea spiralis]
MSTAVVETLAWLIEYWPDLVEARLPMATRRPQHAGELGEQARAERDVQARLERVERSVLGLGESPAPVDVTVLSTILDVLVRADDLAAELTEPTIAPVLAPPGPGQLDARPYLARARACLLAELHDLDEPGPWYALAEPTVHRMYEQVAKALAMLYTGQVVRVTCPWCHGVTPEHPAGGAHTWRVHELPGGQIAIVCHGACEPPAREVGTWWGGAPCWPISEWPRLAKLVRASEAA